MKGYHSTDPSYSNFTPPTPIPSRSSPDQHTTQPLKRTRAKRSCDFCRKRKSRCDADTSIPCSNCRAWGYTCEFQTVRKKRGPPSVYVDNLEKRCKKMENLLTLLTQRSIKELEKEDFRIDEKMAVPGSDDEECDFNHSSNHNGTDNDEEEDPAYSETDDVNQASDGADETEVSLEERLAKLNIANYDDITYTGRSASIKLIDPELFRSKPYVPWPGRDDVALQLTAQNELVVVRTAKTDTKLDIGLSMHSLSLHNPTPVPTHHHGRPTSAFVDKMIDIYFTHLHPFLPIVNKTRFANHRPKVLLYAMLALACRFSAQYFAEDSEKSFGYAQMYFQKVMKRLRDDTFRSRLCLVQAALLVTLYLDLDDGAQSESIQWYTLGTAIRMAQDLGLHRSCAHWKMLPASEIETRHRVFYACYFLDRWLSARAGKPLTILDRDFDTTLPSVYEMTDNEPQPHDGVPRYQSFMLLAKLSEILGRVLKALYAPSAKHCNSNAGLDDPTILQVFDRRLKTWRQSMEECHGLPPSEKAHLEIFYYTILLLLHRPFIEFADELEQMALDSRRVCTEAASTICEIARQRLESHDAYLLCLPTCFVYALFQSALVHLANAVHDRQSKDKLAAVEQSVSLVRQHSQLVSARRALEILKMLGALHGIEIDCSPAANKGALPAVTHLPAGTAVPATVPNAATHHAPIDQTHPPHHASSHVPLPHFPQPLFPIVKQEPSWYDQHVVAPADVMSNLSIPSSYVTPEAAAAAAVAGMPVLDTGLCYANSPAWQSHIAQQHQDPQHRNHPHSNHLHQNNLMMHVSSPSPAHLAFFPSPHPPHQHQHQHQHQHPHPPPSSSQPPPQPQTQVQSMPLTASPTSLPNTPASAIQNRPHDPSTSSASSSSNSSFVSTPHPATLPPSNLGWDFDMYVDQDPSRRQYDFLPPHP